MRKFTKKKPEVIPVTFAPIRKVFKPQIQVRTLKDISGWVDREKKIKYHLGAGKFYYLDEETAREFAVKRYVEIHNGTVRPVSPQERAEILSTVTTIGMGANHG
jgi:hypothetical protein